MYKHYLTKSKRRTWFSIVLLVIAFDGFSQQFNSDNYITLPHGTATTCITTGQRNAGLLVVYALLPGFELTFQSTMFWPNDSINSSQYFTTNVYGKYMFWANEKNTGGAAIFLGAGKSPGYYTETGYSAMHKNYWTALPVTFPLFNNTISWDIMPGALVDFDHGNNNKTAWGFTYSTRVAIYKVIPKTAIVAEFYGTEGDVHSTPEYRVGLRWEPNDYIVPAITYGAAIDGSRGPGVEIGVVVFSSAFLKKEYIKNNHIIYPEK